jgi:hypothetical protein
MTIINFKCECGNTDSNKAIEYDGSVGYEAIICKKCGSYSDQFGLHQADEWSLGLANIKKDSGDG